MDIEEDIGDMVLFRRPAAPPSTQPASPDGEDRQPVSVALPVGEVFSGWCFGPASG